MTKDCPTCNRRLPTPADRVPAADRVLAKTVPAQGGCIVFTGWTKGGYGMVADDSKEKRAHRVVYEALVGEIPAGLVLDHLCHNRDAECPGGHCIHRRCVNPLHLAPVTNEVNSLSGQSSSARNLAKTHCPKGHAYSPENTVVVHRLGRPFRRCVTCHRVRTREAYRAQRQRALEEAGP
ncbi:HNH endonuclease signature motif containing protein [Streptomyces sp. NPDC086838]|uniref:HNH endonuclease signature motif containing protein n=1 Tax=Streptomyces sp. NPDC086838 TaxID=3365762 RepID=UPI0037FECC25